jgi:hypothetical protein
MKPTREQSYGLRAGRFFKATVETVAGERGA